MAIKKKNAWEKYHQGPEREKLFCHDCCCWNTDENICMKNTDFECKNKKINYLA